jgi:hypothetical protein
VLGYATCAQSMVGAQFYRDETELLTSSRRCPAQAIMHLSCKSSGRLAERLGLTRGLSNGVVHAYAKGMRLGDVIS